MTRKKKDLTMREILLEYGIDMPEEKAKEMKILGRTPISIVLLNPSTNQRIKSNLTGKIYDEGNNYYSVSFSIVNGDETCFVEQFNFIEESHTAHEAAKKALKSRNNPETKLTSRAYADVSTKYGDFCVHVEERHADYSYGPYREVSLYHGDHNDAMRKIQNDFNFIDNCFFRWKYVQEGFDQCMMGHNEKGPNNNFWNYTTSTYNGKEVQIPVYGAVSDGNYGAVFINGCINMEENKGLLPLTLGTSRMQRHLEKYENACYTSKAYFSNYGESFAILKNNDEIVVEYNKYDFRSDKWNTVFSKKIKSSDESVFNESDLKGAILLAAEAHASEELYAFLTNQLLGFINVYYKNGSYDKNKFSLEKCDFESMVPYVCDENLPQMVEQYLEFVSELYNIPIDDIIGKINKQRTLHQEDGVE